MARLGTVYIEVDYDTDGKPYVIINEQRSTPDDFHASSFKQVMWAEQVVLRVCQPGGEGLFTWDSAGP